MENYFKRLISLLFRGRQIPFLAITQFVRRQFFFFEYGSFSECLHASH